MSNFPGGSACVEAGSGWTDYYAGGRPVFDGYRRRYTGLMAKGNPVLPVPLGGFALAALGLALHYGFRARRARMVNDPPGLSPPDAPAGGGEQAGDSAPPGPV